MNKTQLTLLVLLVVLFSALPIAYGVYPPIRPAVNDFFGAIIPSVTYWASAGWIWFIGLPYWPAILFFAAVLIGIMVDRFAWKTLISFRQRVVGNSLRDSGLRYQTQPNYQQPQVQVAERAPAAAPPPADTTVLVEPEQT